MNTDAQEIIALAIEPFVHHADDVTSVIANTLTTAGYRILGPSELDAETVGRIASSPLPPKVIAAAWGAWHSRHGGKLGPGPAFSEAITAAIRALEAQEQRQ